MRKSLPALLAAFATVGVVAVGAAGAPASEAPPAPGATSTPVTSSVSTNPAPVSTVSTVSYGEHAAQQMDVYAPATASGEGSAAVVLVHGGSWVKGDKADLAPYARQLAAEGYVVASINYRLATDAAWPAQRDDAVASVGYLGEHAEEYGIDADRIVLVGSSAGGHIATSAATVGAGSELVRGVVSLSAPMDPRRVVKDPAGGLNRVVTSALLRCAPAECPQRYRDAAPQANLTPDDAPSLVFSSTDEWLDPRNSVEFVNRAKAVGVESSMVFVDGDLHARYYWKQAWPQIRDWVAAHTD